MTLKSKLMALTRAIAEEADRNAPFRKTLEEILQPKKPLASQGRPKQASRHRRAPAKIDPVSMVREGRDLRSALAELNVEELKDVVAEFGMDPSKLVMKWKDGPRIMDHIVETSLIRATKGEAFRH